MAYCPKLGTISPVNYAELAADAHASNLEAVQIGAASLMKAGNVGVSAGTAPSATAAGVDGQFAVGVGGTNYVWTGPSTVKQVGRMNANAVDGGVLGTLPQQDAPYPYNTDHTIGDNAIYFLIFGV